MQKNGPRLNTTVSRGRPLGPGPDIEYVCALGSTEM